MATTLGIVRHAEDAYNRAAQIALRTDKVYIEGAGISAAVYDVPDDDNKVLCVTAYAWKYEAAAMLNIALTEPLYHDVAYVFDGVNTPVLTFFMRRLMPLRYAPNTAREAYLDIIAPLRKYRIGNIPWEIMRYDRSLHPQVRLWAEAAYLSGGDTFLDTHLGNGMYDPVTKEVILIDIVNFNDEVIGSPPSFFAKDVVVPV